VDVDSAQVLKFVQICVSCYALVAVAFEVLVFVMADTENHASHKNVFCRKSSNTLGASFPRTGLPFSL